MRRGLAIATTRTRHVRAPGAGVAVTLSAPTVPPPRGAPPGFTVLGAPGVLGVFLMRVAVRIPILPRPAVRLRTHVNYGRVGGRRVDRHFG